MRQACSTESRAPAIVRAPVHTMRPLAKTRHVVFGCEKRSVRAANFLRFHSVHG